jgi:hypothetical protein
MRFRQLQISLGVAFAVEVLAGVAGLCGSGVVESLGMALHPPGFFILDHLLTDSGPSTLGRDFTIIFCTQLMVLTALIFAGLYLARRLRT